MSNDLFQCVVERDGSFRDINFEGLSWTGASAIVGWLLEQSASAEISDCNGDVVAPQVADICSCARSAGVVFVVLNDVHGLFRSLQLFLAKGTDGEPFAEVSFLPDDIDDRTFSMDTFLRFINGLLERFQFRCSGIRSVENSFGTRTP